jgi:hypothetical protein
VAQHRLEDDPNTFRFRHEDFGAFLFAELPRIRPRSPSWTDARSHRAAAVAREEELGNLRRAFEGFTPHLHAPSDVVVLGGLPLHAGRQPAVSRLGQLRWPADREPSTRFERDLFERSSAVDRRPRRQPILNSSDAALDTCSGGINSSTNC